MAWMKIETSVARNRKFVKAGPGPSWLWLCGNAYCQEGLTDGFIPYEAIDYLGVKSARNLAKHLVSAGLWDETEGGWRVHDYLEHNRSAAAVKAIKATKKENGKLGGRPPKNHPVNHTENHEVSRTQTHLVGVGGSGSVAGAAAEPTRDFRRMFGPSAIRDLPVGPPYDAWFGQFRDAYHPQGRADNPIVRNAFLGVFTRIEKDPAEILSDLLAAVENHKAGAQWQRGVVPAMLKWLDDGYYLQRHDPAAVDSKVPVWAR